MYLGPLATFYKTNPLKNSLQGIDKAFRTKSNIVGTQRWPVSYSKPTDFTAYKPI